MGSEVVSYWVFDEAPYLLIQFRRSCIVRKEVIYALFNLLISITWGVATLVVFVRARLRRV